jgi:hypothetical protein
MADGASTFTENRPLAGEFLLGYHSQREALRAFNPRPQTQVSSKESAE